MSLVPPDKGFCVRNKIFFEDKHYLDQFSKTTLDWLGELLSVTYVIDHWALLLDDIERGYNACPPELDDALTNAREPIDTILMDVALNAFAEHRKFISAIQRLDNKFIELTFERPAHPEDFAWYQRRVLRKAGSDYINFLPNNLQVKIELITPY